MPDHPLILDARTTLADAAYQTIINEVSDGLVTIEVSAIDPSNPGQPMVEKHTAGLMVTEGLAAITNANPLVTTARVLADSLSRRLWAAGLQG